jgi:hypothetical protein
MIAAIVAPAGVRNIARIFACLVSRRIEGFSGERADRERRLDLLVVRAAEGREVLDLGLDLVMGSSRLCDAIRRTRKHWRFVLAPPSRMQQRGITPDLIAPGKTCTVFGYPHTSNPDEARIEYIILDGKRIELR